MAQDAAFSFTYAHVLDGWRSAGVEILPFSPLADEAPAKDADLVWLPGGYPELHAGALAAADRFRAALALHAETRPVHGECGGYMALGEGLIDADMTLAEGSMGLFDGVANAGATGNGASADVARRMGWPVVLVIDVSGQAQSAAATALGFARYDPDVEIAGVILNRVASPRHERLARSGMAAVGLRVFGALPRRGDLKLPERHLGLVQASEHPDLDARIADYATFLRDQPGAEMLGGGEPSGMELGIAAGQPHQIRIRRGSL
ncbi:MAG: hypothetical protein EOP68_22215, partial [Sphingomonas sp.]